MAILDLIRGPVTSLLIFGNSGFVCMLVAVMQRPRLRQCTFHRPKNIFADKYLSEELKGEVYKASLVNTLPKTKKDKYTAVTEAHKECT